MLNIQGKEAHGWYTRVQRTMPEWKLRHDSSVGQRTKAAGDQDANASDSQYVLDELVLVGKYNDEKLDG